MDIQTLTDFFMWCTLINLGFFLWTALMCLCCKNFIYRVHGKMFGLSQDTTSSMLYGFLGLYKIVFIVFVLVPWIALCVIS